PDTACPAGPPARRPGSPRSTPSPAARASAKASRPARGRSAWSRQQAARVLVARHRLRLRRNRLTPLPGLPGRLLTTIDLPLEPAAIDRGQTEALALQPDLSRQRRRRVLPELVHQHRQQVQAVKIRV